MTQPSDEVEAGIVQALHERQLPTEFTILLGRASQGDCEAKEEVFNCSYSKLRAIAKSLARSMPIGSDLQATALVSEAFLRLEKAGYTAENRRHFLGLAAASMRSALADDYRKRTRKKRHPGEGRAVVPLPEEFARKSARMLDPVELDEALERLNERSSDLVEVIHLRFFLCMTVPECAQLLEVSASTIERRFREARDWLREQLL